MYRYVSAAQAINKTLKGGTRPLHRITRWHGVFSFLRLLSTSLEPFKAGADLVNP